MTPDKAALMALAEAGDRMAVALHRFVLAGCSICGGDCSAANPPIAGCPIIESHAAVRNWNAARARTGEAA